MVVLTPRLQAVADYVEPGSIVADIGTDHAYVPAYLLQHGIIRTAYACDINPGPLQNARQTIAQNALSGVEFLLSDGMLALEGKQFDTVIIAGMGGELIARVMAQSPLSRQQQLCFILQPMTKADYLRTFLYREGFAVREETFAAEEDKLYSILKVFYTGESVQISNAYALLGGAKAHPLFEQKRQREIVRLRKIDASLQHKADSEPMREEILQLIKEIEEY